MEASIAQTRAELRAPVWRSIIRLSLVVALVVAVCCGSILATSAYADTGSQRRTASDSLPQADSGPGIPAAFAKQKVEWKPCGDDGAQCAKVKAPMDWSHPDDGDTVELALLKYTASGPAGPAYETLFLNPGGPGGSGVGFLYGNLGRLPEDLRASFDLVSWDPRGVGRSTPVDCLTGPEVDELMSHWSDPSTDEGIAERRKVTKKAAEACHKRAGKLLEHVGTVDTVSDLNLLRHLLGQKKLNYLGLSYGTRIGSLYSDMYPSRVGRMVFDGSVDPTLTQYDHDLMQMRGFEKGLENYLNEFCVHTYCPFVLKDDKEPPSLEVKKQRFRDFLTKLSTTPLKTDRGRDLTLSLAYYGIISPLYSGDYLFLNDGLDQAIKKNDGSLLLKDADSYASRRRDGTYASNAMQAYWAIGCADLTRYGAEEGRKMAEQLKKEGGVLGPFMAGMENMCEFWPGKERGSVPAKRFAGEKPILMVAEKGDPVTPLSWSLGLKRQLGSGARLLLVDSNSHTSVLSGNKCVDDNVQAYFLRGTVPKDGETCSSSGQ